MFFNFIFNNVTFLLLCIIASSSDAHAGFLFSPEVNELISKGAIQTAKMTETSRHSKRMQNQNFQKWTKLLAEIRNSLCQNCQIKIKLANKSVDSLKLSPSLSDENQAELELGQLDFTVFKIENFRSIVKSEKEFVSYQSGTVRNDCKEYVHIGYQVPTFSDVILGSKLNETNDLVDLYAKTIDESVINSNQEESEETIAFRLDGEFGAWPERFYLEKKSENQDSSNWIWFEGNRFYLVKCMRGICAPSSWNVISGNTGIESNGEIRMESLYKTPDTLSLKLETIANEGLYRLESESLDTNINQFSNKFVLVPFDEELEISELVEPITCEFEYGLNSREAELHFDENVALEKIADTFHYNSFLSSLDFKSYPLQASTFSMIPSVSRGRVKKIISFHPRSLQAFLESGQKLKAWFKNLQVLILKNYFSPTVSSDVLDFLGEKLRSEGITALMDEKTPFIQETFTRINGFAPKELEFNMFKSFWNRTEETLRKTSSNLDEIKKQVKIAVEKAVKNDKNQKHKNVGGVLWVETKLWDYFEVRNAEKAAEIFYEYRSKMPGLDWNREDLANFLQADIELRREFINRKANEFFGKLISEKSFDELQEKFRNGAWDKRAVLKDLRKIKLI